jgi:hypothetical protein
VAKRVLANLLVAGLLGGFFYGLTVLFREAPVLLHNSCPAGVNRGNWQRYQMWCCVHGSWLMVYDSSSLISFTVISSNGLTIKGRIFF